MVITLIASGSRGDVQPYIALGKGLKEAGYQIRLVSHENYRDLIVPWGLDFISVAGNIQDIAQNSSFRELLEQGNFLAILREMSHAAKEGGVFLTKAALEASHGTDLFIAGLGGVYTAAALSEKFQIPVIQGYYIPSTPTREYPNFVMPFNIPVLGKLVNPLTYFLGQQMIWQGFRAADAISRKEILDLEPAPILGPLNSPSIKSNPILYAYSPSVIPPPEDWPENHHVTGYWYLDERQDWSPPKGLLDFLNSGSPPIFIGFGSMSSQDPQATARLILDGVAQSGERAIILSGWGGMEGSEIPDAVYLIDSIPHSWLFPRVSAVIHHGGAGTTSAGLRAGVPSVIIPFFGDQPFWGRQINHLGVGPKPIPRKKLTPQKLAEAIKTCLEDRDMIITAASLGEKIRAEDGVGNAVKVIRKWIERDRTV